MPARTRVYVVVAACAAAAAGLTVGVTLATRSTPPERSAAQPGRLPLVLDLGVRTDAEAVALRRAARLYDEGKAQQAAAIFDGSESLEGKVGAAVARWPQGFDALAQLAASKPRRSLAQLQYGLALFWHGEDSEARVAWQQARRVQPDTPYAIRAQDLLYPDFSRGLPDFVPSFAAPEGFERLPAPRQLTLLERRARAGGARDKLLYGVALQRLGRRLSALRQFERAAALAPDDPEAQVAVAVGRFDKAAPARTFSQLGPLARRYPRSQSVRFHLGLCLLWLGGVDDAKTQLRHARSLGPSTPLGRQAQAFLERLKSVGTS
jgi:tetratricopeptide (TPR) repeat protein